MSVRGLFVGLIVVLSSTPASADWPMYRGARGDGKIDAQIAEVDWTSGAPLKWKVPTTLGFSSFAVADDRAFTLVSRDIDGKSLETCVCLDARTGDELWANTFESSAYKDGGGNAGAADNRGGDGPRSTPTAQDGKVYIYDAYMTLTCLDATNGKVLWKHAVEREFDGRNIKWLNATSPLVHGNSVYVGGGGEGRSFLAFDKDSGRMLWAAGDETITHATPTLAKINGQDQLLFFVQSGIVSVSPATGEELWRTNFEFRVSTAASPVVEDNLVYCSAGYSVGAGLFEIDKSQSVERLWLKKNKLMNHWSTPIVHDGYLYGIFEFKKYGRAPLKCVDLRTGEIQWEHRGFGPGNCIMVGDKLVVLSDAGEVVLVKADPNEYQELARAEVLEGKCWSTPAYSDGCIYVRSTKEGACIQLPQ